jgi:hypothetical protein
MPDTNSFQDIGVIKIISGVAGSFVSLRFIQGSWIEKLIMSIGGSCLSYFATTPIAVWLNVVNAEGLVGFLIGLFGMSIAAKVYEVIQFIDAKSAASQLLEWIARKWKA